jgi:hypothetical protein
VEYIKPKTFSSAWETIKGEKNQLTKWEKIFVNHVADKGFYLPKYIRNSYTQIANKTKSKSQHK